MSRPRKRHQPTPGRTARLLRRVAAVVSLALMTVFFVGAGTSLALRLKWIAAAQIVPVALSASVGMILFWVLFTFLFGRVYCSIICPLGIMQDIFAFIPRSTRRRRFKKGYHHSQPRNTLRYAILAIVVCTSIAGFALILSLLDPYGAFGRMMNYLVGPIVGASSEGAVIDGLALGVAATTLVVVAVTAFISGRTICNTVCPVGSALSLVSRHSIYRMDINTDVCIGCGLCARVCKAHCIDAKEHTVDMSRCVVCFDCMSVCDSGAINYTKSRHRLSWPLMMRSTPRAVAPTAMAGPSSTAEFSESSQTSEKPAEKVAIDRRRFLATGLIMAAAPAMLGAEKNLAKADEAIRAIKPLRPVTPPGIRSVGAFLRQCVGCGACIAACPAKVLRSSGSQYGIGGAMHPVKNYDDSYCRYSCTICTEICPTGALSPLTISEKHNFRVGIARVDADICIGCGLCARDCPRLTITMARPERRTRRRAVVDPDGCIGCGVCQYICPAPDGKAIRVDGLG